MSEPFIAEIKIFAGNFAPRGYAFCNGQLLPISQNTALFSLIGTTYGGDGRTTTGLPNLQGRAPMHPGRGPGLTARNLGQIGGAETATLSEAQMASHNHNLGASTAPASSNTAVSNAVTARASGAAYDSNDGVDSTMNAGTLATVGGGQSHNNLQPYLAMNFIIALTGVFPSRS